jgi:hypothetical protein
MVNREELIEQAYFFRVMRERVELNVPMQESLSAVRDELLATTNLPKAIDFMRAELLHQGGMAGAMERLSHYFTPFQAYVVREAENERGRFDLRVGLEILQREAEYRSDDPTPPGAFLYQFETLCRNRLRYDQGLSAISQDPIYDADWREWVLTVRRQIGIVDLADLIYVRSQYYVEREAQAGAAAGGVVELDPSHVALFGAREGKIALANRGKDPLYLLAALQRQLNYPAVPRLKPHDDSVDIIPQLMRRVERLETRLKLMEDESKGGIDLTQFYVSPPPEKL